MGKHRQYIFKKTQDKGTLFQTVKFQAPAYWSGGRNNHLLLYITHYFITLTVVIPVKNGSSTLERCLQSIRNQTSPPAEIIVIDSGSSDNSKEIAAGFGCKVLPVSQDSFDHGLTRNFGVQHAKGDLIYLTVQDAYIPVQDMLEKMTKHFDDSEVAAVSGHQAVPHEKDKNPFRWHHPYSRPEVSVRQVGDAEGFRSMPQDVQQKLVAWDNVVAMYRKNALTELPFVQTEMSEDWVWSYQALQKGWKLLRDPSLVVYHYHHHTPRYVFAVTWSVNYHFYKFFGYRPVLPAVIKPMLRAAYHLFRNKEISLRERMYWTGHNFLARMSEWYSDLNFLCRMKMSGRKSIEKGYQKYCRQILQGKQKE